MIGNARKFREKADKLLRLYSLWHETHREEFQRKCLVLLSEILVQDPNFSIRREFQKAF
ncbi:MAG: hypothetical protein WC352_00900 [Candidatus Omnitrophota bacterium]|jgi:hypothetical protein